MKLAELEQAGRAPQLPLVIDCPAGELHLEQWLRVLPGQRYVARASWRGQAVLAKLLVGARAERHYRRERDGATLLAEQGLPTPALLEHGFAAGQGGWLLFEYLEGAQSLDDAWRAVEHEPPLSEGQNAVLGEALECIARLHAQGLWQSDLHLDNLLRHAGRLQLIDGGGVQAQTPGQPLSRDAVLDNLALFFAQLPAELEPFIEELLVHYLLVNAEHALPLEALLEATRKARQARLRDYLGKLGRDCSLFAVESGASGIRALRRDCAERLRPLLEDPDAFIAAGTPLKQGGSATVARVELDGRAYVIKRYNIKNLAHWLKRCWRPTRAWHSWVEGNRLAFLGIATPQPLAVWEPRRLGLRGRSYLVTEYLEAEDIIARLAPYVDAAPPEAELQALDRLFAALLRERISHGDLKGTNLLWQDGRWALIDLDALRQHGSEQQFRQAFARDRARLLRNWPADSALYRLLDERLPKDSLKPDA